MKKGDKIIALIIIFFIFTSYLIINIYKSQFKENQSIAVIKQDGNVIRKINLQQPNINEEFKIIYSDNHYNIIRVEPGRIRFIESNCPDKLCVKSAWISRPGQTRVCLPHRTVIEIEGNK